LLDRFGGEKVVYLDESVDGDFARVQTNVLTPRGTVVRVAYSMLEHDGRWLIVDISSRTSATWSTTAPVQRDHPGVVVPGAAQAAAAKVEEFRRAESTRARGRTE